MKAFTLYNDKDNSLYKASLMDKSRQELLKIARKKLENARYSAEMREQVLRTIDLLLEIARDEEKSEENARATVQILANATKHHNLFAIIEEQAAELDALKRISKNLTASLELPTVLNAIVTEAMKLIKDARDAHIFLYQDGTLHFGASLDSDGRRNNLFSKPREDGLTYTAARTKEKIIVENMRTHPLFSEASSDWAGSIIAIPLMMGHTVVGVMNMARWSTGGFRQAELRLLDLLSDQAAVALINARLHHLATSQAMSDVLTGLPNRRALDTRLENEVQRSARYDHKFAVLMMDLDGFKAINDTFGHSVGDVILKKYARYLFDSKRATDFLARYGGDEMTMILPESDLPAAQQVAMKIKEQMASFEVELPDKTKRQLGLSGGISIFPTHGRNAAELLRAADEALYRAKKRARGTFAVAQPRGDEPGNR